MNGAEFVSGIFQFREIFFHQFRKLLQHLSWCQCKFTGTLIQPVDQGGILFQQRRYLPVIGQKLS